ncbi:MAG: hypothetical protein MUF18_04090 [Fimbriiglobus sp.]|jgi:hypothetical protein|nr:hypothetical protein [Fimbriiglobus sp.]
MPLELKVPNTPHPHVVTTCRLVGKVALISGYTSGWYVYPIDHRANVCVNGGGVTHPTRLRVGDVLGLKGNSLEVVKATPPPDEEGVLAAATCTLEVRVPGHAPVSHSVLKCVILVGSSERADVRLAPPAPEWHSLLVYHDRHWYLHDLTGGGVRRLTGLPMHRTIVASGEVVEVGGADVCIRYAPLNRLDLEPEIPHASSPPAPPAAWAEEAASPVSASAEPQTPVPPAAGTTTVAGDSTPVADPLYHTCRRLMAWIMTEMAVLHKAKRPGKITPPAITTPPRPMEATEWYKKRLAEHPGDLGLLTAVADFMKGCGYTDLHRIATLEVLRYHPHEPDALIEAAALLCEQAGSTRRPLDDRRKDLARAERFLTAAERLRPSDRLCGDLLEELAVQKFLLNPTPERGRPSARPHPSDA